MSDNKKVAFVQPTTRFEAYKGLGSYPLGILYVATKLKHQNPDYDIRCFDETSIPVSENGKILEPFLLQADSICIGTNTSTAPRSYKIADKLRDLKACGKANQNQNIIFGGSHPTALPDESIKHADIVIRGEGETLIDKAVKGEISGITKIQRVQDLNLLDNPDYSLLKKRKKRIAEKLEGRLGSISTSRGCPYKCDFCGVWIFFGKPRYESADKTFGKVQELYSRGFRRIFFHDDNFSDPADIRDILFDKLISFNKQREKAAYGGGKLTYLVQDRVNNLQNEDYVEKMARSGCTTAMISFEFGDDSLNEEHKKDFTTAEFDKAVKNLKKNNISSFVFCMIDPHRPELAKKTIEHLEDVGVDYAQFSILTPLPGTVLYKRTKHGENRIHNWKYYNGMVNVTEPDVDKRRESGRHLSWAWQRFYSPKKSIEAVLRETFKGNIKQGIWESVMNMYGRHVGKNVMAVQP